MFLKSRINQKEVENLHRKPEKNWTHWTSHWTKTEKSYNL
jgi:hypothetical protein